MKISKLWKFAAGAWAFAFGTALATALVAKRRLPVVDEPDGDEFALVAIFDSTSLRPTSQAFRGGSVLSFFGSASIDLRRAGLSTDPAHLRVTTIYGATDITVPDTWLVTVTGPTFASGVTVKAADDQEPGAPRLSITARTMFGGLVVTGRPVLRAAEEMA